MKFGELMQLNINRIIDQKRLQCRFQFRELEQSVEFEISFDDAMAIMDGFQKVQRKYGIPIPESLRPERGKPLSLVKTDADD